MNTVAVCDTEPVAIEGLRSLLQTVEGLRVVAAETSLSDGMDAVRELKPRLVVIDKSFGVQHVTDFLRSVANDGGTTDVIVWSASFSEQEALRLLQAGAAGVVRKTSSLDTLVECIRHVAGGAHWMEDKIIPDGDSMIRPGGSPLTTREAQVLNLVERGMRNKEIAENLGIRVGTVKIHLKHIFEKTGIRGRYGLALSGLREKGLLTTMPV